MKTNQEATIGQYSDYLIYDPEGLGGEPRILIGGKELTQEEISLEMKSLRLARELFGNWIIDRVIEHKEGKL